ncbi:hypothetical protein [Plesiocystis pacifica]|uniref:hypothetical protein n=1 Tax=Plesiocystis pacifica TaxID=191768 RepID=UPI0012F92EB2|nr:hypothetical protein [Plesiocystis pacifica]
MRALARRLRAFPRSRLWPLLAALLVVAPTLSAGLALDDVLMRVRLVGADTPWGDPAWWELYTFARPELNAELRDAGLHPWWSDLGVKMRFFRPLSAATHVLDYTLWPDRPGLHHGHSVLWYLLCVLAVRGVLRLASGVADEEVRERRANLGALIFAISAPHVTTVAWLAARNTLIAFVLGCGVIALHIHGRRQERGRGWWLAGAVVLTAIGLLASEAALGALAYVGAWQLCADEGPLRRRLAALVPYAGVVAVWRALYVRAGFGAANTGIYHDPSTDLPDFLRAVATNLPALFSCRWALVPVDGWVFAPSALHAAAAALGALLCLGLAAFAWPLLAGDRRARAWALGSTLALLPFAATMPMDRLVLFAGLGAAAVLVEVGTGLGDAGWVAETPARRRVGAALVVVHLIFAGPFGLLRALTLGPGMAMMRSGYAQAPRDEAVPEQTFVYVLGTFHRVHYTTLMRAAGGEAGVPRRAVVLSSMFQGATMYRVDADTLEVAPEGGFMAVDMDRIHRRDAAGLAVGDRVRLPELEIEILERTDDGRPSRAAFHFDRPLEDPSLRWLIVAPEAAGPLPFGAETQAFELPAIGATVVVEGVGP